MTPALLLLAACWPGQLSAGATGPGRPVFDGSDLSRPHGNIQLTPIADGFEAVTDIQFPPEDAGRMLVVEKPGRATWLDLATGERKQILKTGVRTSSELGLLGLAFHPHFAVNGRVYTNRNPSDGPLRTVISEWTLDRQTGKLGDERILLEVDQPFENHDAGQLRFGPDGYLYLGLGDGGAAGDPRGNGQNPATLLGRMLRIDVDHIDRGYQYRIPPDNPYVGLEGARAELWAIGLRNPWRFDFDGQGRLIVGDVGQNTWEELDVVAAGSNLGWNSREGRHCYQPTSGCPTEGLVEPIFEYGRQDGYSVTGGVLAGARMGAFDGWYIFGDYGTGRLWAMDVRGDLQPGQDAPVTALGRWNLHPSTFGRSPDGAVYVTDFPSGRIYRLDVQP